MSQRLCALRAGISYKALQLIEKNGFNTRLSTLTKIAAAFSYPKSVFKNYVSDFFELPRDSVAIITREIHYNKNPDWRIPLFNFVDRFRKTKDTKLIEFPPYAALQTNTLALLASTTESLCQECGVTTPGWCAGVPPLTKPFFVSGIENLKALALIESPSHFRKRNIFVLANFLERH